MMSPREQKELADAIGKSVRDYLRFYGAAKDGGGQPWKFGGHKGKLENEWILPEIQKKVVEITTARHTMSTPRPRLSRWQEIRRFLGS